MKHHYHQKKNFTVIEYEYAKKEYEYAKKVWNTLNIKNLGEYHDLYVQLDSALLADVFENFTNVCLKEYKLEPCYFVSAPGLC